MTYPFERESESGMIYVDILLDDMHEFKMVLDTGALRTTFDTSALYMADYTIGGKIKNIKNDTIETANGIIDVKIFEVDSISALGHTLNNKPVQVYDFLAHGILSDYDGVLGIDFFENTRFCIDMNHQTIEIITS